MTNDLIFAGASGRDLWDSATNVWCKQKGHNLPVGDQPAMEKAITEIKAIALQLKEEMDNRARNWYEASNGSSQGVLMSKDGTIDLVKDSGDGKTVTHYRPSTFSCGATKDEYNQGTEYAGDVDCPDCQRISIDHGRRMLQGGGCIRCGNPVPKASEIALCLDCTMKISKEAEEEWMKMTGSVIRGVHDIEEVNKAITKKVAKIAVEVYFLNKLPTTSDSKDSDNQGSWRDRKPLL